MSATTDILIKDLAKTLVENKNKGTSAYDTQAEVIRIEGNTAWVHIPGGISETPVQLTTNAKKGDIVQVRVSGGRAWLYGNATSPPTDDTKAVQAQKTAVAADEHAVNAITSAMLAQQFADDAKTSADQANTILGYMEEAAEAADTTLTGIYQDAKDAKESADAAAFSASNAAKSADSAYKSASTAIEQLSIVEDIVGVLGLVSENGVYAITQDTEILKNKWYFEVSGTAVEDPNPESNPYSQGWYERTNGIYHLTEDTSVDVEKTYYTIVASPVTSPVIEDINTYYQLVDITTAIQNYVTSHLAFADGVLYLQNGNTRVSLSTDADAGLIFYNNGQPIAQYGSSAIIGDPNGFHISITPNYDNTNQPRLSFYRDASNEVAYISGDKLYITQSVVLQQMDVGTSIVDGGLGQWSWKIHVINGSNNLYLKWLG